MESANNRECKMIDTLLCTRNDIAGCFGTVVYHLDILLRTHNDVWSIPLTLAPPQKKWKTFPARSHQAVVQIQKLAVEVFEFVPLLDENVQEKFFTFFEEAPK